MRLAHTPQNNHPTQPVLIDNFSTDKYGQRSSAYLNNPNVSEILQDVKRDVYKLNLLRIVEKITGLKSWKRNWDGYGSEPPQQDAVDTALSWIRSAYFHLSEQSRAKSENKRKYNKIQKNKYHKPSEDSDNNNILENSGFSY